MTHARDIICFSSIDWDFIWQGHQQVMAAFAEQGHRVLFVENTGVRAARLSDVERIRRRLVNWRRGTQGFREERPNLFVLSPVVLPFPYSRLAGWINRALLLRTLRRWMGATDFHRPIVWTFLPTPLVRDLIRAIDPGLTVYYCIDDLRSSSPGARRITASENDIFREADLVFVTSERLAQRARQLNAHVHLFPFAVDYEAFERVRLSPDGVPSDVRDLPRPIVGYIGGLHQWVDQPLVCAVAEAMPEASVVMVGPKQTDVSALGGRSNIHLLGARPHADLPGFIKSFDVALVPYLRREYTEHVYPTKMNEYLAMGTPVVATGLPEVRKFTEANGGVVAVAADTPAFVDAVREAARTRTPAGDERRVAVARTQSWSIRIAEMGRLIDAALDARRQREERWDVALTRVVRRARRRTIPAAAALVTLYLLVFHSPLLWAIAAPLHMAARPQRADAIVVLAGGAGEAGRVTAGSAEERVTHAVDLYRQGLAPTVVFASGYVYLFEEAEVMRALATAQGIPASAIHLETRSGGTSDQVRFLGNRALERRWRRVLLVSSPYHMRRLSLTWRKLAPGITAVPTPTTESRFYRHRVGATGAQMRAIAHEYAAIAYYWARGWL